MLVLDATVLINLGGVRALWILRDSVDAEIVVVDEVASEILREPAITDLRMAIEDHWIRRHHLVIDDELALFAKVTLALSPSWCRGDCESRGLHCQ